MFSRAYALWFTPIWLVCGGMGSVYLPPSFHTHFKAALVFSYRLRASERGHVGFCSPYTTSVSPFSLALQLSCCFTHPSCITASMPRSKKDKLRLKKLTENRIKKMEERSLREVCLVSSFIEFREGAHCW